MAIANGAAMMGAEQLLFLCQAQALRRAKVEGPIIAAPMVSPTGEAAGRQMEIPFPGLQGTFRRYGRNFHPLNNCLNATPSHKGHNPHVGVCLKAVQSGRINGLFVVVTCSR